MLNQLALRYFQVALLCFIWVAKSYGQTGTRSYHTVVVEITKEKKPKRIYTKVEVTPPALPGLDSAWAQSFEDSLNRTISIKRKAKSGKYIVSVRFLIERDGSMNSVVCLTDPGFGLCEQVMDAIKRTAFGKGPRWSPDKVRPYAGSPITPPNE